MYICTYIYLYRRLCASPLHHFLSASHLLHPRPTKLTNRRITHYGTAPTVPIQGQPLTQFLC